MTINERVRAVRNALGLTQIDFGKRLAVAQSYLTNIETGKREVTEKIRKLICLEFSVSEQWLLTGQGEMFVESDSAIVSQLAAEFELDIYEKAMISSFVKMKPGQREFVKNWVKAAIKEILDDEAAYKEFRAEYDKEHALPFAARGGDASGLAEAAELFEGAFSAAKSEERKENKDGM